MENLNENKTFLSSIYSIILSSQTPELVELLEKKQKELDISERTLSDILGIERSSLRRILERTAKKIDIVDFIKIGQFLNVDINDLAKVYLSNISPEIIGEIEKTRKATFILNNFDLKKLAQSNFIKNTIDFEAIEKRIVQFFGLNSIFEYNSLVASVAFSQSKRSFSDLALQFWVATAANQLKMINNPNEYNQKLLLNLVPSLRQLTTNFEKGLLVATKALYAIGVTVIFQSYLPGTSVRGGTLFIKNRPCIIITDFQKRYDSIWFALAHEIYHVLRDLERIKASGYHLTGEEGLFYEQLSEDSADEFARQLLLPKQRLSYIKDFIDIPGVVEEYAAKWKVHPSIIYGHYLRDVNNETAYQKYRKELPRPDEAIKNMLVCPWEYDTLEQVADKTVQLYSTSNKTMENIDGETENFA